MLVFVHINKSGGNTMSHILRSSYGFHHCQVESCHDGWKSKPFSAEDLQRLRILYPHLKSIGGHHIVGYVELPENGTKLEYFTFMRDPVKRCASRFQFNVHSRGRKDLVFEEWIQLDKHQNLATKWIAGKECVNEAIRIIQEKEIFTCLTENFDESIVMLKGLIANDLNISYKRVNVAGDNTLARNLLENKRTRQMIFEAQCLDLELYTYVSRELYTTYQREYGPSLKADVARFRQTQDNDFNYWNMTLCRLKHYLVYKPLLYLYRKGVHF
jgi:hypothetical protein